MIFRRQLWAAAAATFILSPVGAEAWAQQSKAAAPAKPQASAVAPDVAKQFITDMGNRTVQVLSNQANAQARNDAFTAVMLDAIDFDALALQTLGRMSRTVTPTDKREFTQLFAAYVIDVAVQKFGTTQVTSFNIGALKPQPNGDIMVNTAVNTTDKPLNVDWRVHTKAGQPCINDIEVEGYSLVIHYRGEFERAGVSTVKGLIDKLRGLTQNSVALPVVRTSLK